MRNPTNHPAIGYLYLTPSIFAITQKAMSRTAFDSILAVK